MRLKEALGKAKAKTPRHFKIEHRDDDVCRSGTCPTCDIYLCEWESFKGMTAYCARCGQKIDWRYEK